MERRGLLKAGVRLGLGVGTGALLAGCSDGSEGSGWPTLPPPGAAGKSSPAVPSGSAAPSGPAAPSGSAAPTSPAPSSLRQLAVQQEERRSVARNASVRLITILPLGARPADLPVCLALHGRDATSRAWTDLGLPEVLAAAIDSGVPPFAVVAVDGGDDTYWRRVPEGAPGGAVPGDDPQRMLLEEVPKWLAEQGLRAPEAAIGISMGAFGSLGYARNRGAGFGPVAVLSPALFRDWAAAKAVGVFRDEADWRTHEPLLHLAQPYGRPVGVWCGTEDPFYGAARQLTGDAIQTRFTPGGHTPAYWRQVMPEAVSFLGRGLAARKTA